jgi:hypothetical protein
MVEAWFQNDPSDLRLIARRWFDAMRSCGDDVHELLHDGHPTACIEDAGFAYVNVFTAHVNVGFFRGAELPDPAGMLEGTGRFMRHVKIRRAEPIDEPALLEIIRAAYLDMQARVAATRDARR